MMIYRAAMIPLPRKWSSRNHLSWLNLPLPSSTPCTADTAGSRHPGMSRRSGNPGGIDEKLTIARSWKGCSENGPQPTKQGCTVEHCDVGASWPISVQKRRDEAPDGSCFYNCC